MRILLPLIAACLLAVVAAPAQAAWPALAGTTTIEGSQTGYATVRLDRPLTFDPYADDDGGGAIAADLEGAGRLYGVILREDAPGKDEPAMAQIMHSEHYDYEPPDQLWFGDSLWHEEDAITLPAGVYRLYVVADGRPVRAVLRFPGLDGATSLTPQVPVPQRMTELPRVDGGVAPNVVMRGGAGTLESRGMVIRQQRFDYRQSVYEDFEACVYPPGSEPASAGIGFAPTCGGSQPTVFERWLSEELAYAEHDPEAYAQGMGSSAAYYAQHAAAAAAAGRPPYLPYFLPLWWIHGFHAPETYLDGYDVVVAENAAPGRWHLGGNARIAGAPSAFEMLGAWIGYDPAPGTPVPAEPADAPAPAPASASSPATASAPVTSASPPATATGVAAKKPATRKKATKRCAKKARGKKAKRRAACAKKKPRKAARRKRAKARGR